MCESKSFGEKAGKEGRWMNIQREKTSLLCLTVLIFIDHHLERTSF